ncbi:hypothetical protein D1007_28949 [Hordeum vulgare]|nr:hypothetical protein D1007_28949 [Hordeum vulgare]
MGSLTGGVVAKRPWFLCLHGFRTSDKIMLKQLVGNCTAEVTARFDLVFADAPFPAEGKSDVDDIFHPPYYEWFQFDKCTPGPPRTSKLMDSDNLTASTLVQLFQTLGIGLDSAAIALTGRAVLLGTHNGTLHILDFQGNQITLLVTMIMFPKLQTGALKEAITQVVADAKEKKMKFT